MVHELSLHFGKKLEFLDFMRIFSRVMSDAEIRRAGLLDDIELVLDTLPTHKPTPGIRALCSDISHMPGELPDHL